DRNVTGVQTCALPILLTGTAISQPATITWPEAVAQLAGERAKAETCVALVKKYGDEAQIARAQLTYTTAKADADAAIAGLITVRSEERRVGKECRSGG